MVPEWQDAYMNYNSLKTLLKEILIFRQQQSRSPENQVNPRPPPLKATSLTRRGSLFRAFSGLTSRYGNRSPKKDKDDEVILVMQCIQQMKNKQLDDEFNKVVNFYRDKVEEVVKDAEELNIQMDALIALRIKVDDPAAVTPFTNQRNTGYPKEVIHEEHQEKRSDDVREYQMASLEVLNHIKINTTAETPLSAIKNVFHGSKSDLHFNKKELRDAKEKLKQAFIEFHEKLRLLKNYVTTLADVPSVAGCFFGCSLALVVAIIVNVHARDLLNNTGRTQYMNTIFPLYSLFGFLVLHMLMYAANVYYWTRYRVNYSFIFGFKPGTELGYTEVLLFSSGLSVLTLAAVLSNLEMELDPNTKSYKALTELLPLGLVTVVLLITVCPFNIFYRANRFYLLVCLWRCICAPFYAITLPDFFLADQRNADICNNGSVYDVITIVIAVIPYWIRVLQCIRRFWGGHDSTQALNALKYFSTIIALVARTIQTQRPGITLQIIAGSTSVFATIFNTYWDMVMDWGLLCRNSENPWLRDKLILPNRSIYFIAMVLNVILRLAWMQTVMGIHEAPFLHRNALIAIIASLEIIRRGLWNFFRLENEHLNNVGKFRVVKSVPLPFSYENDDKNL
ncbi:hypothetical protein L1987_52390 [Smallanthus sonchifolius]|uniref:Uncharacterized protein n=1 Tax=Smallanthus sonchifolius TaxID=185202 RepID=A0ACB9EU67_9ASTR|nr:hypothetical protein L1987_52390 [Smallanthus sonchifolius]